MDGVNVSLSQKWLTENNHPRRLLLEDSEKINENDMSAPFMGAGAVWFELPKSEKKFAEYLGFEYDEADRKVYKLMKTTNGHLPELEEAFAKGLEKAKKMYGGVGAYDKIFIKTYLL